MTYFGTYFGDYAAGSASSDRWSAKHLVRLCRRLSGLPRTDLSMTDLDWCEYLSLGQDHWLPIIATKVPESQYGSPIELTVSEDGKYASFPNGAVPFGQVQVYHGVTGPKLTPGGYHDPMADFVPEGSIIRAPLDRTFSFANGLYARVSADMSNTAIYTETAAELATTETEVETEPREPILMPEFARILIVYHALALWASEGGFRDPAYYENLEIKAAWDDRETGKLGIITQLMHQFEDQGATQQVQQVWWRSPDLGNLRHSMHR